MDNDQKYKVISQLQLGIQATEISDTLNVPYAAVLRLKKQFDTAVVEGTVNKLLDVDKAVLNELAETITTEVNKEEVAKLTEGLNGLDKLQQELQQTASHLVVRTKSLALSCDSLSELSVAADILCNLQVAFFNKNVTQVNVQNNIGGGQGNESARYNQFLSDKPAIDPN